MILIVDDDQIGGFAMKCYLEDQGFSAMEANAGHEALDLLDLRNDIALVLIDIAMPEMDGFEVIGRIRSNSKTKTLPIIAVTGSISEDDRVRCLEAGANEYITKPVDLLLLMEKVFVMTK